MCRTKERFSIINLRLASCACSVFTLAFCIAIINASNAQEEIDVFTNSYDPLARDESYRSSANFHAGENTDKKVSALRKIDLIRYYLGPKIPGGKVAVVVDTGENFYDVVKQLWKLVLTGGQNNPDVLLFVYNDTDCSLVENLTEGNGALSKSLDRVSSIPQMSNGTFWTILECVNLAVKTMESNSSIMLLTGRKPVEDIARGENTAMEMTRKRIEFNCVLCVNASSDLEDFNVYKKISLSTNGHFIQFTNIDYEEIAESRVAFSRQYKTGNYTKPEDLSPDVGGNLSTSTKVSRGFQNDYKKHERADETADLLYDPKISVYNDNGDQGASSFYQNSDEILHPGYSARMIKGENGNSRKEDLEIEDMELASLTAIELASRLETTSVEVTAETSLVGKPGSVSRLSFRVTNSYPLTVRHYFQARSTSIDIVNLQPRNAWIESGQSVTVVADVLVPTTATDSTIGTVTLIVQSIGSVEKSTYIYVRATGSTISDGTSPTINYSFNNNCAGKLGSDICSSSLWTVDITVTDSGSGLQRVSSSPKGIQAISTFVSGTKSATKFQYASTCCQTTVIITGDDLLGNTRSETIDVTVWYNLSQGEIAAIVIGTLLILLILVIIVLIIVLCVRKRKKSQDLPYTQRATSRNDAR